ncbi:MULTISPECIES: hypothetical protein [unclassified Rhizobium]|uniref:hypothetical protein n=1 Tax=unclassified Rhizobium TaxID=2613769 RepID=UPI00161B127D|nr:MULTISPECIES: hypothetical protein [unclassified Rhizobium]MBB3290986.1 hypothetical protein [Rhizobium sp. BK252]MBB3405765.1 hypothetical protein [Rhizobium sp. BK289]MBB3418313.1 hypothetical protein [Rhizobium sp. BK284]MBB3486228.1 hypothetical protein [Rhizobium sp. BK347]MDK4724155.1 hypothetical protein [Rhizobium sp. CNPSo 3968]
MRTIKVMADYQCFPLWEASPGAVGNIDPKDLPISFSLRQRLMAWAKTFDATLNIDDPLSSGFGSERERIEFREEGATLAQQLQEELGARYIVIAKL